MRWHRISIIFFIALALRLIYLMINYEGPDSLRGPDSVVYESLADTLIETRGFNRSYGIHETERVPLYIAYLATFHYIISNSPLWPVIGQIFIDSLTCILIALIATRLNKHLGLVAGILGAINLNMISNSTLVFTDCLFLFFLTAMLLTTIGFIQRPSCIYSALVGLFFALALLTRSVVMFYTPLLILILLISILHHKIKVSAALRYLAVCCLIIALLIFPLLQGNAKAFGYFRLTSQSGTHCLYWVVPLTREYATGMPFAESQKEMHERVKDYLGQNGLKEMPDNPFESSDILMTIAKDELKELGTYEIIKAWTMGSIINLFAPALISTPRVSKIDRPSFYLTEGETPLKKIWNFFSNTKNLSFVILLLSGGFVTVLSRILQAVGLARIGRGSGIPLGPSLFLIFTAVYFLAITGPVTGVKYRLPIEPVLIVFMSDALGYFYTRLRGRPGLDS